MRRPLSLTLRLTVLFGLVATIVFAGFGWFVERSIKHHFESQDTIELKVITQAVSQALPAKCIIDNPATLKQRLNDILVGHHGAILYVAGENGKMLFASPGEQNLSLINSVDYGDSGKQQTTTVRRWSNGSHTYRVLTQRLEGQAGTNNSIYTISVAVAIDYHLRFLISFRRSLWLMIGSGIALMGLMGWIAVRQGQSPLRIIIARIRLISASELNIRLSPDTVPRELSDLAVSFNEMLGRMEDTFQRLSNFSADIAHELRTPITSLLTQTQVALSQSRSIDEYREILYSNIEEYERMAQMVSDMLFLAKTDNGLYQLKTDEIDLSKEAQELIEYYEAWAEERGVSLTLRGNAILVGDRSMMRRALGNLLSNAIKHTPSDSTVKLILDQKQDASADQTVTITVENPGSVIASEHISKLFDRFYRADTSRQRSIDGAGLGLAIAKSIIDIHGGKIEAKSSQDCTQFRITIPIIT